MSPHMAPKVGFEPTTYRLTAGCSTFELLRNNNWLWPTLPRPFGLSTISDEELNFCVRYGNRCILFSIITILSFLYFTYMKYKYYWWRQGDSNSWPPACKADALPAELWIQKQKSFKKMVTPRGIEPTTCWLQVSCSANWATPAYKSFISFYNTIFLKC